MGSVFAGLKAGAVASVYFAGSVSLFNILLLLASQSQVLSYLSLNFPTSCPVTPVGAASSTAQSCFNGIILTELPVADFVRTAIVGILFAAGIGVYFDYLPGSTYFRRTLLGAMIMVVSMLFLGLYGLVIDQVQAVLMTAFEVGASVLYAVVVARLYRRFTREVEFRASEGAGKIFVDKRNLTGKKRTFGLNSSHKIELAGATKPFRGWLVSGGVQVEEAKQPKTSIRITGDGFLRVA